MIVPECIEIKSQFFSHGKQALQNTFFFPFIFISWSLITLQYCSGFSHTLTANQNLSDVPLQNNKTDI